MRDIFFTFFHFPFNFSCCPYFSFINIFVHFFIRQLILLKLFLITFPLFGALYSWLFLLYLLNNISCSNKVLPVMSLYTSWYRSIHSFTSSASPSCIAPKYAIISAGRKSVMSKIPRQAYICHTYTLKMIFKSFTCDEFIKLINDPLKSPSLAASWLNKAPIKSVAAESKFFHGEFCV